MSNEVFSLWVYLARSPLLWLTVTILVYCACDRLSAALRRHPLANPVLLSVALTSILLLGTHTPYAIYFDGAQFIHFLLGPATVALGIRCTRTAIWCSALSYQWPARCSPVR
jgi:putative effector of murein hydrolase